MREKFNLRLLVIPLLFIALGVIWLFNTDDNAKEEETVSVGEEKEESRSDIPSNNENDQTNEQLKDEEYYTSEFAKIRKVDWEWIDSKENQYESVEQFLFDVDHYVKVISEYIGKQDWQEAYINKHPDKDEIKIEITGSTRGSYTAGGYNHYRHLQPKFFLSVSLFQVDYAPTAHEVTHIIAPFYSSLSLREGLAQYTQDKFGKNPSVFNYGEPVIPMSKQFLIEEHEEIIKAIGTEGIYERASVRDLNIRGV